MTWHWIDYAIVAIVGLSVITGLFRGFVKELIALCVWILALWLAFTYSPVLDPFLAKYLHDKTARTVVAFVAILLGTLIAGGLFNALLSFILSRSGLSGTDRLLGMGFGFVRGVFIVALLMLGAKITTSIGQEYTNQSFLYPKFDRLVNWLYTRTPDLIKQVNVLDKGNQTVSDLKHMKPDP